MYLVVFGLKLGVYLVTGVLALLAEALHTLSDIFVSGFLLVAVYYARRRQDQEHMFGHGRAENVAALVAATLFISFTSYNLYVEAVPRLFADQQPEYHNLGLAVAVLLGSMALAAVPLVRLLRQQQRGPAAGAQTMELVNDQLGLAAALAGTLLVAAGVPIADPIAAIVVATIIAIKAVGLFREHASLLMGRSPGGDYLRRVADAARAVPGVLDVRQIRAEYVGPGDVHAGLHVVVPADMTVAEARQVADEVRRRVHDAADPGFCVIEVEPPATPAGTANKEVAKMPPHCDALDGPVVTAAARALQTQNVELVLPYVHADGEAEVRQAFARVLPLRARGDQMRDLADRWFYETVVRVHRAGEGAPYTGLKPAGLDPGPVLPLAEKAMETGDVEPVYEVLAAELRQQLERRLRRVRELAAARERSVADARAWVEAMLGFEVYAHHTYQALSLEPHGEHAG
jgi:cation diffusion facilitator family transporter